MKRRLFQLFAVALAVLLSTLGGREAWAGGATNIVQTKQTEIFQLLNANGPDMDKKIAKICDDMMDYGAIIEGAMGDEWANRSAAEKAELTDLMKQLIQQQVRGNLKKVLNFKINYVSESKTGNVSTVKTTATPTSGGNTDPVEINYKLSENNGAFKVVDIDTEGVSMVSSWRSQFPKIVKKDGYAKLVQLMKNKLAKGTASPAPATP